MSDTPNNHSRSGDKRRRLTVDDNVIYLNFGRNRETADADKEETATPTRRARQSQHGGSATSVCIS